MADTQTSTGIKTVGRVMVPVSDQDRAIEFYEKLGFEKLVDIPFGNGDRWVEVTLGGASTTLALVNPPNGQGIGDLNNIALDTDDIDATHSELRSRGVDVDAEVSRMGGPVPPMFWMRDPDGNTLLVVEPSR